MIEAAKGEVAFFTTFWRLRSCVKKVVLTFWQ